MAYKTVSFFSFGTKTLKTLLKNASPFKIRLGATIASLGITSLLVASTFKPVLYEAKEEGEFIFSTDYKEQTWTPETEKKLASNFLLFSLENLLSEYEKNYPSYKQQKLPKLIQSAESGDIRAQYCLGLMSLLGKGTQRDFSKAAHYFDLVDQYSQKHESTNHDPNCFDIHNIILPRVKFLQSIQYSYGIGVEKDDEKAFANTQQCFESLINAHNIISEIQSKNKNWIPPNQVNEELFDFLVATKLQMQTLKGTNSDYFNEVDTKLKYLVDTMANPKNDKAVRIQNSGEIQTDNGKNENGVETEQVIYRVVPSVPDLDEKPKTPLVPPNLCTLF
jgi:hypothetical protein